MDVDIRPARAEDIPHMARFAMLAFGGYGEVMYEGVIPGRTAQQLMEHRFARAGTTSSLRYSRVAEGRRAVLGGLHAFPADLAAEDPEDLLIPEERYPVFEPFKHLDAAGSFYVNILAVYAEHRGRGIAWRLMEAAESEAKAGGFKTVSLIVFAENLGAMKLYEGLGYREAGRAPVVPHPSLDFGGDLLLLTRRL